jgi:hypothetical protein
MDYGIDTNRTFEMKDLLIFTDNLEVGSCHNSCHYSSCYL